MRRRARIDANQPEIVAALEAHGCLVQSLASLGRGVPDLLVMSPGGILYLLEVKAFHNGTLTDDQQNWLKLGWIRSMHVRVVRTPEEALKAVGVKV